MRRFIDIISESAEPTLVYTGNEDAYEFRGFGVLAHMMGDPETGVLIYSFSSSIDRQGNGERALRWLRERCESISVSDPGEPGSGSFAFWRRMCEKGLIDAMEDDQNEPIYSHGQWHMELDEAPISHVELMGDPNAHKNPNANPDFQTGTSFDRRDAALLNSPKAITKIVRAFQKTPHDFEVFFANTDAIDGERDNESVDEFARTFHAGVWPEYGIVKGKPGVIRVLILANLSPEGAKMPMTAWTLAHKIGHSLQDECYNQGWMTPTSQQVSELNKMINRMLHRHEGRDDRDPGNGIFVYHGNIHNILTMKSARDGKVVNNDFEVFAEIIAQYLITGRATFTVDGPLYQHEADINKAIKAIFDSLSGMVLVEV